MMKIKFKPQYVLSLGASAVIAYVLLLVPNAAHAANLSWSSNATVTVPNSGLSLTILAGSTADQLVTDSGSIYVVVRVGEVVTFEDPTNFNIINPDTGGSLVTECITNATRARITSTLRVAPTTATRVCPGGGGLIQSVAAANDQPIPSLSQQQQETNKAVEPKKQPEVKTPGEKTAEGEKLAVEKPLAKVADVVKSLNALKAKLNKNKATRNKAISASENAEFGLEVAKLNADLHALGVLEGLKADLVAKLSVVETFAIKVATLEARQAAVAKLEATSVAKENEDVTKAKNVVSQLTKLFKGGLTAAEVTQAKTLLTSVGLKTKVTTKSKRATVLKSANAHVKVQAKELKDAKDTKNLLKRKAAAAKAVTTALKNVQKELKKLNK